MLLESFLQVGTTQANGASTQPHPFAAQQLWIGFGFLALLVIFLIIAYFASKREDSGSQNILRFLCALCAGFAGGFITGGAVFEAKGTWGGLDLAVSGTVGFALFLTVWFTFQLVLPPGFSMSVPEGWTFERTVRAIAQQDRSVADFVGFTAEELSAALRAAQIESKSPKEALAVVRTLGTPGTIRVYDVEHVPPAYTLRIRA